MYAGNTDTLLVSVSRTVSCWWFSIRYTFRAFHMPYSCGLVKKLCLQRIKLIVKIVCWSTLSNVFWGFKMWLRWTRKCLLESLALQESVSTIMNYFIVISQFFLVYVCQVHAFTTRKNSLTPFKGVRNSSDVKKNSY